MPSKTPMTAVRIDRDLRLKLYAREPGQNAIEVQLTRATAQFLADALFQYAGAVGKKGTWRDEEMKSKMFGAEVVTDSRR